MTKKFDVEISQLLDAGVHFGHKTSRWNPRMASYIYGEKDGVHIIDLQTTAALMKFALTKIYETVKEADYIPYTLFASFDLGLISELKDKDPDIHIAGIKVPGNETPASELKEKYGIEAFIVSSDELTPDIDKDCKDNGIYLAVYSIDNWYELEKIKKYNIKTVVSNYPGTISNILNRYFPLAI